MLLFNPSAYDAAHYDEPTRRALLAVRRFFEAKGHAALKAESHDATWYDDFLEFPSRLAAHCWPCAASSSQGPRSPEGGKPRRDLV